MTSYTSSNKQDCYHEIGTNCIVNSKTKSWFEMKICCLCGIKPLHCFALPKDAHTKNKWIAYISKHVSIEGKKAVFLCDKHFKLEDFTNYLMWKTMPSTANVRYVHNGLAKNKFSECMKYIIFSNIG